LLMPVEAPCPIQQPDQALREFGRLFNHIQAVGLTNACYFL